MRKHIFEQELILLTGLHTNLQIEYKKYWKYAKYPDKGTDINKVQDEKVLFRFILYPFFVFFSKFVNIRS